MRRVATEHAPLVRYLRMLAGPQPQGRFIEVRYPAVRGRMRQLFVPATRLGDLTGTIESLSQRSDVYTGVLLRTRKKGGNDAVSPSHLLWVELDRADAVDQLGDLPVPPTMTIASGSPGHAHTYWLLRQLVHPHLVPDYNRHLAEALGGDLNAIDAARILRPPSTRNHKHAPPTRVELLDVDPSRRYHLGELLDAFPRPQPTRPRPRPSTPPAGRTGLDEQLLSIPAAQYVRRLIGREPDRGGKIACPLHDDRKPSLQLYPDGTFYCYGCGAGGSLYDFAGQLWGLGTKGRDFIELRRRLAHELLRP